MGNVDLEIQDANSVDFGVSSLTSGRYLFFLSLHDSNFTL